MDNLTALKKVYVSLGGDADDVADCVLLAEVIDKIAEQIEKNAEQAANAENAEG